MRSKLNSNCNSKAFLFANLMDVFQNLNNLRHNNDFLNNLLQDVWYLDEFFLIGNDFDWNVDNSINNL